MAPTFKKSSSEYLKTSEDILVKIDAAVIQLNPNQPRRYFDHQEIAELATSIQEIGILQPLIVRQLVNNTYELISGERRLRALQLLGWTKIPVIVKSVDTMVSAKAALIENMQRTDLNPIEIAIALKNLMHNYQLTQEAIADTLGKKRSTITNFLRLLQLPMPLQELIQTEKLSMGHAKALLPLAPHQQIALAHEIQIKSLSVRQTEKKVRQLLNVRKLHSVRVNPFLSALKNKLEHQFGTPVTITFDGQNGRIAFDYYNLDDLDRLLQLLGCHVSD